MPYDYELPTAQTSSSWPGRTKPYRAACFHDPRFSFPIVDRMYTSPGPGMPAERQVGFSGSDQDEARPTASQVVESPSNENISSKCPPKRREQPPVSFKRRVGSSKFKGVLFVKSHKKWRAQLCYKGKKICVGSFSSELEAAKARDRKAKELFGQQSRKLLNFTPTTSSSDFIEN